jgi:hypothetical protein
MSEKNLVVTSFDDLRKYAQGAVVELPPFASGQPFVARLKRPSMMGMVKTGKIPNSLLTRANELFTSGAGGLDPEENELMAEMFDIFELMAKESLVSPSYDELKEIGLELTDDQLMFLFNYAQSGVKALESFRTE